jgi:hypothetical protein
MQSQQQGCHEKMGSPSHGEAKIAFCERRCQQAMDFGAGIYYHSGKIYRGLFSPV